MLKQEFVEAVANEERVAGRGMEPAWSSSSSVLYSTRGRERAGVRKDFRINKGFKGSCPTAFSKGATQRVWDGV